MGLPLLGAALTGLGLLGSRSAARKAQRQQDAAIADWIAYQDEAKDWFEPRADANREANYVALNDLLSGATLEARNQLIGDETDRLYGLMTQPEYTGAGTTPFEARKLAEATQQAREMIRANAKTRSYGNSFGGMSTVRDRAMREGASDIGFNNEMTLGDMSVLQKKQSVQPVMYQYNSTGLGDLMTSFGANMLGQGLAGTFSGGGSTGPISQSAWTGSSAPVGYMFPPMPRPTR